MIPITFNQDDTNNAKKGNVRAQDLASYLSISMPKRAGVLDMFDNPCTVYQTNYSTGYAILTFHKGYINIYGRCIYIEEGEQVQVSLPTDASTVTGTFGIRVNLGETGANEVTWFTKTTALQQDNILNNEVSGVYEYGMYTYTATANSITLTSIMQKIENIADYLAGANFTTQATTDDSNKIATTAFTQALINQIRPTGTSAQEGEITLGNGLRLKWGLVITPSGSQPNVRHNWGNNFSNVFVVLVTPRNGSQNDAWVQLWSYDTAGFTYRIPTDRTDCMYLAIGV